MPGGHLANVRSGAKAELLANYLLEHLAFVSRVPREEDVGIDLMCTLNERIGTMLCTDAFFTVQVKSNKKAIVYESNHAVKWIERLENPLFIATVDVTKGQMDLYSTWRKLNAFLQEPASPVRLVPGHPNGENHVDFTSKGVDIYLGDPVVTLNLDDLSDDKCISSRRSVLKQWIEIDRLNLVRRGAKLHWVEGPLDHETNSPPQNTICDQKFYTNPKNLHSTLLNYINASAALLRESVDIEDVKMQRFREDLARHLCSQKATLGEWHLRILRAVGNLDV